MTRLGLRIAVAIGVYQDRNHLTGRGAASELLGLESSSWTNRRHFGRKHESLRIGLVVSSRIVGGIGGAR
jgi:hypothetical protein